MKLYFDSIIFYIQKQGGISVLNSELKKRLLSDFNFELIPNHKKSDNYIINFLLLNLSKFLPIFLRRYLSPLVFCKDHFIFHSSYYRICYNVNAINIITVHDFIYEKHKNGLIKYLHILQKRVAIKKADHIVCVSHSTKNDLLYYYPNIDINKISVIHNGVDISYRPLNSCLFNLNSLGIDFKYKNFILYIGDRKSNYKNFNLVVESCKRLNLNLVLIGKNLEKCEQSFLSKTLNENSFVQLSLISNENLNIIYNSAFCLLYPSIYEGFGIPILEAQKAGCPVIASSNNAFKEIASNSAILLDNITATSIIDAILSLQIDKNLYKNLIYNGFDNASKYSWDKCYYEYKKIYTSLLN
jgi:glycosyltransferase involved in cell wall biosynthesis